VKPFNAAMVVAITFDTSTRIASRSVSVFTDHRSTPQTGFDGVGAGGELRHPKVSTAVMPMAIQSWPRRHFARIKRTFYIRRSPATASSVQFTFAWSYLSGGGRHTEHGPSRFAASLSDVGILLRDR
jgi:hypothetical protein